MNPPDRTWANSWPCCSPLLCLSQRRKVTSGVTGQSRRPCPLNKAPRRQQRYSHQQTNEPTHGRCHSFWQVLRQTHDVGHEARRQEHICERDNRRTEPPSGNAATPISTSFVIQRQLRHALLPVTTYLQPLHLCVQERSARAAAAVETARREAEEPNGSRPPSASCRHITQSVR
jgi:hypothetical protein